MRLSSNIPHYAALLVTAYDKAREEYQPRLDTLCRNGDGLSFIAVRTFAEAPSTYEELVDAAMTGCVPIAMEGGEHSIYGKVGNTIFRTFHDAGHLLYGEPMDYEQELNLAVRQWGDIYKHIPEDARYYCSLLYHADTVSQSVFCHVTGQFPQHQRSFVAAIVDRIQYGVSDFKEAARVEAALHLENV